MCTPHPKLLASDSQYRTQVALAAAAAHAAAGDAAAAGTNYRTALTELTMKSHWREAVRVARDLAHLLASNGCATEAVELSTTPPFSSSVVPTKHEHMGVSRRTPTANAAIGTSAAVWHDGEDVVREPNP
jgi:hypothetical protein